MALLGISLYTTQPKVQANASYVAHALVNEPAYEVTTNSNNLNLEEVLPSSEEFNEEALVIEPWMYDMNIFNTPAEQVYEPALDVEMWMTEPIQFSKGLEQKLDKEELDVEPWMKRQF